MREDQPFPSNVGTICRRVSPGVFTVSLVSYLDFSASHKVDTILKQPKSWDKTLQRLSRLVWKHRWVVDPHFQAAACDGES